MRPNWKLSVLSIIFILCVAPSIVSYDAYDFKWDDSDYLTRSILVSKDFWSGNMHDMRLDMVSIRPPVMTLLSLPWGPLTSWDAAGKSFVTLNTLSALVAAFCLFAMLRIGFDPLYFFIACLCTFAAYGPYPTGSDLHINSTGFMVDMLFALVALAALLLIPYESAVDAVTTTLSTSRSFLRGLLWACVFSMGVMTKVSFAYFILLVVPALFFVRMRRKGGRAAFISLASLAVCSSPIEFYWLRYGLPALRNGWAASFGHDAGFYFIPLWPLLSYTVRMSPGVLLSVVFVAGGLVYLMVKRRELLWDAKVLPLLIAFSFLVVGLASSNRQLRYVFPAVLAPPFLVGLLFSSKKNAFSQRSALIAAIFAFCGLAIAGWPLLHRPDEQSIVRAEAVVNLAAQSNVKSILMATDSQTLNAPLVRLAAIMSPHPSITVDNLGQRAMSGLPIEADVQAIQESDLVVFQNKEAWTFPYSNLRVPQAEEYVRQHYGDAPIQVTADTRAFEVKHDSQ